MKDRPTTDQEVLALPVGPRYALREDVVDGRLVRTVVPPNLVALYFGPDDTTFMVPDEKGDWWRLGQYASGEWFKSPLR